MNYSYRLGNPLDYLKLLFLALFDWRAFPKPERRDRQIILAAQGTITVVAMSVGLWLLPGGGDLKMVAFGVIVSAAVCITLGLMPGLSSGVALGIAISLAFGVALSTPFNLVFAVTASVMFIMAISVTFSVAGSVAPAVTVGAMLGLTLGLAFKATESLGGVWGWTVGLGIALVGGSITVVVGLVVARVIAMAWEKLFRPVSARRDWLSGILLLALSCLAVGYLYDFLAHRLPGVIDQPPFSPLVSALLLFLIYSRLPLWPLEASVACFGYRRQSRFHEDPKQLYDSIEPWYFDRHIWLPLPGEAAALRQLETSDGVQSALDLAQYSSHVLAAVTALRTFVRRDAYTTCALVAKLDKVEDRDWLFKYITWDQPGAIASTCRAYKALVELAEQLAPERAARRQLGLQDQLRELLRLSSDSDPSPPGPEGVRKTLQTITGEMVVDDAILYSRQVADFYTALAKALTWSDIQQTVNLSALDRSYEDAPHLFPPALKEMMDELGKYFRSVSAYDQATSPATKSQRLLGVRSQLNALQSRVKSVPLPSGPLLQCVLTRWESLIQKATDSLSRGERKPIPNPYEFCSPVYPPLFVGREDVMRSLENHWAAKDYRPSVVLCGHRRMGKTSILRNLGRRFGRNTTVVDFNMQRASYVESTWELLYNLALAIYYKLTPEQHAELREPDERAFEASNPFTQFDRFLKRLDRVRRGQRFIVTMDEFELVENLISEGRVESELYGYWRGLIHTYRWLAMAFAGSYALQGLVRDPEHPLFASVCIIDVSFLAPRAARRLITEPTPEFSLDYAENALKHVIDLTNCQPHLVQLVCHVLVNRFNQQVFERGIEREWQITQTDVEKAICTAEFHQHSEPYFAGVWGQTEKSRPSEQIDVLKALVSSREGLSRDEIVAQTQLAAKSAQDALEALSCNSVVLEKAGRYRFAVELMRRWVERKKRRS